MCLGVTTKGATVRNDLGVPAREPTNMITKEEGSNLSFSATNEDPDTMLLRLGFLSAANCLFCMFLAKQLAAVDLLSHQCLLGPRAKVHHLLGALFILVHKERANVQEFLGSTKVYYYKSTCRVAYMSHASYIL